MKNISRQLVFFFAVSLLALPLTGCENAPWDSGMTLALKVDAPKDGTTVNTPTVAVNGRVLGSERASAKLTVNDQSVPVKDDKFTANLTLKEGVNLIEVVASSSGGAKPSEKVRITYVPAKQ